MAQATGAKAKAGTDSRSNRPRHSIIFNSRPNAAPRGTVVLHAVLLLLLFSILTGLSIYILCPFSLPSRVRGSCHLLDLSQRLLFLIRFLHKSLFLIFNMVSSKFIGGLAARASFLMSSAPVERASEATYTANAVLAVEALQTWYDAADGLWTTTGWWNGANCLQVLADFASLNADEANELNIGGIISNTFTMAQQSVQIASKTMMAGLGLVLMESSYTKTPVSDLEARGFGGFINNFYDDEGWWALALIRSYDVTGVPGYLDMAQHIFEDMKAGVDSVCGGGIWWSKDKKYKNAIANELYLAVAASLANRPGNKQYYLDAAIAEWNWFKHSGMINSQNLINDGLTINSDGSCTNNGANTWTYNQGVILGGLVELSKANSDKDLLTVASNIAGAAISSLSKNGILYEGCEPNCGADGAQFKGIFMRNLRYLHQAAPQDAFKNFLLANADSIWASDRTNDNKLGITWTGPASAGGGPNAGTHSSAMDALVGAMAVAS